VDSMISLRALSMRNNNKNYSSVDKRPITFIKQDDRRYGGVIDHEDGSSDISKIRKTLSNEYQNSMVMSPSCILPLLTDSTLMPSLAKAFWSILIPFMVMVFKYLL
jgi:hypothetical protein